MRLFIAIELKEEIRNKIYQDLQSLRQKAPDVKWVEAKNYHFTLKFLGGVPQSKINLIEEIFEKTVDELKIFSFEIEMIGIGAFPSLKRPKVLWVDTAKGKDKISLLALRLDEKLEKIGFEREKREYQPHLTIARINDSQRIEKSFLDDLSKYKKTLLGSDISSMISLMKSTLTPLGPIYEQIYNKNIVN